MASTFADAALLVAPTEHGRFRSKPWKRPTRLVASATRHGGPPWRHEQCSRPSEVAEPNGRLVSVSSAPCGASTSDLSTSSSTTDLQGILILELASRLDAFSGYPFQTWLPGDALGRTTGTPGVCPSRSSRTRDSSPQDSCAHRR